MIRPTSADISRRLLNVGSYGMDSVKCDGGCQRHTVESWSMINVCFMRMAARVALVIMVVSVSQVKLEMCDNIGLKMSKLFMQVLLSPTQLLCHRCILIK